MVVMMVMMMMIYKGKVKHEEARKLNSFICFVAGVNGDKVGIMWEKNARKKGMKQ